MTKITMKIDGMMCGMCEAHVNEAIRGAFRVRKVTSSHTKGECTVISENDISDEELKEMFAERAVGFVKTPTSSAENFAQAFYRRKTGAAFSKEMKRSVRAMLADYTKESC